MIKFLFVLFFSLPLFSIDLKISDFNPQGNVKRVKQVKVSFSDQMVPLGNPKVSSDIFIIDCPKKGKGRWLDDRNYIYEFPEELEAGLNCRFNLKPDFKSISGKKVNGKTQFQFSTGGPSVIRSTPYEGADIEEDQIIIVKTDTEINPLSFAGNVHFAIEGIKSKVEAILLSDNSDEVKEIIKNKYNGKKQNNTYFIKSKLVFPNHKKVELIWDIGVSSKTGVSNQDRQVLTYQVRAPFAVTFSCERENPNAACIPFMNMFLNFNSNFTQDQLSKIYMEGGGKTYKPKVNSSDLASGTSINYIEFEGPFPENEKFKITIEKGLQDEAGRNLENQNKYPMAVSTAEFPPLVKFSGRFGIIESEGDATLPVTVRNLEPKIKSRILKMKPELDADLKKISGKKKKISPSEVLYWLRRISATNRTQSIFSFKKMGEDFDFKKPNGPKPFEVVGIPLKEKGFYAVELESSNLGKSLLLSGGNMFVPTLALVTNMSVHFKHGKENSLVWVTSLNDGKPVENVKISILNCENKVLYEGKTNSSGLTIIDKSIKNKYCSYQKYSNGLIVFAEKGDDFSFVHSGWNKGIENWRFNLPYGEIHNRYIYHTILDRPLFRAGETVSMKHLGRIHKMEGFNYTSKSMNPDNIKIVHDGSGKEFSFSLDWKKSNAATSVWKIPKEAKLGEYSIYLVNKKSHIYQKTASFRVEEFRVPLLKGTIQVPSSKLVQNKEVKIGAQVQYLAGGPASNLPVKFKYWFRDSYYESVSDYDDYSFNSKSIKEGKFSTQNYNNYEYGDDEGNTEPNTNNNIQKKEASLDKLGTAGFKIENIPESEKTQVLAMEMDYRDPNGEIQTIFDSVKIYPSKFKIGIKQDGWISDKDNVKISTIVLDLNNKPVKGKEVSLTIYSKKYLSHRKRLVGGFYSYDSFEEIEKVGNFCSGKTDELGMLTCENPSPVKGTILLEARIEGENVNSYSELYISGDDEYRYYSVSDNDRMDVLPEKKMYEPGDTARFQVKMPFSKATALVTVEREGVIDNYIKELSGKSPVVEIPIKGNYGPNVFVSVLAVRGRVGEPKPTAMIDLARPAYKLGITHIKVGWQSHTLKVDVASNKEVYKTRENSKIKVKVKPLKGKLPKDSDVAIAVVDEGLLDLKNNDTWDVLSKMMQTRSLEVNTASAQMQVVGRRHFGLKSLPNGGGGGSDRTRELFDTLLHWNPSVKLDKNGEAEIEFKTNDSLTSFKVVAIAVGGNNYFGHGSTSIRVTQDLLLFSGVPPVAREGDELFPELSLRNSSENPMVVKVEGLVEELNTTLPQNTITLEPGESKQVFWKLKVPNDLKELTYNFNAKSENFKDSLKITQQIIPAIPVTVQQGTIFQLEENYKTTIKFDENALPKRGGINLVFSNSLMNSMDGIKDYMSIYPYSCLEQQVSKSIILYDKKAWDVLMGKLPAYLDESGFAKYFPDMWKGEPILTSYILSIADERGWEIPDEQKSFMLGALVGFVEGRFIRNGVLPTADLLIRKLIALETLSRYGMAKKEQIATLKIIPNNLPVSALIDWWDILERVNDIPDRSKKLKSVENIIKSRLSMQGTVMKFTSESSDRLWWLMISPDQNAARLVLSLVNRGIWKKDMGRIIRGALSRQKRGRWDTTLANSWGLLAMEKFASKYEKEKVSGKTSATSGQITKSANWSKDPKGRETFFPKTNDEIPLTIDHSGKGKPWVTMQVKAAVKIKEGQTNGYTVEKEFIEVERKDKSKWSVGDIIKIKIKVKADVDMTWVVLNDPIPTGASILTGGLRRNESTSMNENYNYYSSFEERKFDSYRVYYEYAPEGEWKMEYTIRLNQDGNFSLPPTRIEAMYSPDLYGTTPNPDFKIIR